ncbi:MAG: M48 family metalloprotease [Acidobacteria bacterium]|nr:M48 family metalloprotease [Acidobacteriota bacterium]
MIYRYIAAMLLASLTVVPAVAQKKGKAPQQREVKVQKTSLSKEQETQLGKEAAAEVERTMEVVSNPQAEAWLNKIGQRLAATPQANAYPYYFKLVNEDSINAFALPGGPMFVHTGLIKAAESEDQVAGVLAHEMSHVALRHGANQMSKAQTWQTIMGVVGAAAGMVGGGQCGLMCQAIQMGGGLAENSVLMKFSRDHERDADLNGARMMAAAGYDPAALAKFFQKLEGQQGAAAQPKGLQAWLSSHPSPGNRVQYIQDDMTFYARREYTASSGSSFPQVQKTVAALPPAKPKPATMLQPVQAQARTNLPQGFKDLQTKGFAIGYPGAWQAGQPQGGGGIFVVPQGGAAQQQNGGVELITGVMIDYSKPKSTDLSAATSEILQSLKQGDQNMKLESTKPVQLGGKPAMLTRLTTKTSNQQDPQQTVLFYTSMQGELLFTMAAAAPPSQWSQAEPVLTQITSTVQFK